MLDLNPYKKGSVFFAKIPTVTDDLPLMQKTRPVVIMNAINTSYGKVLVAPVTSKPNKNGVHVTLEEGVDSTVLVDYVFPIYVRHLHTYLGSLSDAKIKEVCYAFNIFTGMVDAPEEDIKKYFPNQSIYNVDIKLTPEYNIPVSSIRSPVAACALEHKSPEPDDNINVAEPKTTPKPSKKKGRVKIPSFDSMSMEELMWFATSEPEEIVAKYGCCKGTATRKKKLANERIYK